MAENNTDVGPSFMDNFSCKICFEILRDPVQCQNNEHYFCRECITKHLHCNSETCPLCMERLVLETLRPAPRIVASVVSQMKKPCCSHVSRGCTENVEVDELLLHQQTCGYAPVVCSNEGCTETVNRCDKESHETEECKFRKITCESCDEEMALNDYEKHQCTLRKEMNEVKSRLDEMSDALKQVVLTQGEILENLKSHDKSIKDLQDPLRRASSTTIQREGTVVLNGQIFIFGGYNGHFPAKSLEVFNWSTKTWTLVKVCLFFSSRNSFSFLYGRKIMVCSDDRIEYLKPSESGFTSNVFPARLPSTRLNGVLNGNRIITFGQHIQETSLERPWRSSGLIEDLLISRASCSLQCFGNIIYVVGFSGDKIEQYNIVNNKLTTLITLPYKVYEMATVAYKDNIIILGGTNMNGALSKQYPINDVLMFNIHTLECKRLPSMLERRYSFAAVIMGDVIVVMGGTCIKTSNHDLTYFDTKALNTVEYFVIGGSSWKKLPDTNLPRSNATACVYV